MVEMMYKILTGNYVYPMRLLLLMIDDAQPAIAPEGRDLQFLCCFDLWNSIMALTVSRASIAQYPSGTT